MDIDDRRNAIPSDVSALRIFKVCLRGIPLVWPGFLLLLIPMFGQFFFVEQSLCFECPTNNYLDIRNIFILQKVKNRFSFHAQTMHFLRTPSLHWPFAHFFCFSFHLKIIVVDIDCFSIQTINRRREEDTLKELPLAQAQQLGVNQCVPDVQSVSFVVTASAAT